MPTYTTELGLNLSKHPSLLANNELSGAYNMIYAPDSGKLITRGGLSIVEVAKFDGPINFLYTHVRKRGEAWLIAVVGKSLFKLFVEGTVLTDVNGNILTDSEGKILTIGDNAWSLLANIESENPSMISFNGSLLVADGSDQGLLKWDGTTVARITASPQANLVYSLKNYVICNSVKDGDGELDAVYFSAAENENEWDITKGAAIIRAGYGDGMEVNGFSSLSNTLVISKQAVVEGNVVKKQMFGLNMAAQQSAWSADYLSGNNSAVNGHALLPLSQDVIYIDTEGIERLVPTMNYGDIENDPIYGGRVNNVLQKFVQQADDVRLINMPQLSAIWIILRKEGKFHKMMQFSKLTNAFTDLEYSTPLRTATKYGDVTFAAGDSGYLYILDESDSDDISPTESIEFTSNVKFKQELGAGDLLLSRTVAQIEYLVAGNVMIEAYDGADNSKGTIFTESFVPGDANKDLYEANDDLYNATYSLAGTIQNKTMRGRFRGTGITLQVRTKSGRIGVNKIDADIRQVGM